MCTEMRTILLINLICLFFVSEPVAQIAHNWRGPGRQGIFHEKGLLQEWPEKGPDMLWVFEGLGKGFSSPVVANNRIYVTGKEDEISYVFILDMEGRLENKFPFGPEHHGQGYPGTRNSPAVAGDLIYLLSSEGLLTCMKWASGEVIWRHDLFNDFDGNNINWGITENLLIDGDKIYCTPGGKVHNIIALNRHDGELFWASSAEGEPAAYCSPLLVDHNGKQMLITHTSRFIVGLDAASGKMMWSHPHEIRQGVHPNTPIYHEGRVFAFTGYGFGGVMLELNPAGDSVTEIWTNGELDTQISGAVMVNGVIYGSGHRNRYWSAVDWETGRTIHTWRDIDKGTVIYADGRLYCYSDRGELALVEPVADGFNIKGLVNISHGSDQHWAHKIIHNGTLYVRRGNALMAFKIKA